MDGVLFQPCLGPLINSSFRILLRPAPAANGFARCLPRQNRRISELKKARKRRMAGFHPFFDIPSHPAPAANGFARCLPRQNRRISELKKARKRRMAGFLPFFLIFHRTRRLRQTVLPGAFPGRTENLRIRYKSPARKQLLPRRAFINVFQSARRGAAGPSP